MRVGFVHGVMNTDNMSILGLTIDYGPYGWLEGYDPQWTPNTTDARGPALLLRQPAADRALEPGAARQRALSARGRQGAARAGTRALRRDLRERRGPDDGGQARARRARPAKATTELLADLFALLQQVETDMTLFFRLLATVPVGLDTGDSSWMTRRSSSRCGARSTPRTRSRRTSSPGSRRGCAATPRGCGRTTCPPRSACGA